MSQDSEYSIFAGGDVQFDSVVRPQRKVKQFLENCQQNRMGKFLNFFICKYYDFFISHPNIEKRLNEYLSEWYGKFHFRIMNSGFSIKNGLRVQLPLTSKKNLELWNKLVPNNRVNTIVKNELHFNSQEDKISFPIQGVLPLTAKSDISFCNLECPVSEKGRIRGCFRADPIYIESIKRLGIDIVSVANNHAFDASEEGFVETLKNLEKSKIIYVGGGTNLTSAKAPRFFKIKGMKIAFLAYAEFTDNGFYDEIPEEEAPGIMPFYPPEIINDIKNVKKECDILILSLHWGIANNQYINKKAIKYAHQFIDAGADVIVGHHSHLSKGIEIYKGKPIFYSLGNFIFGIGHQSWKDNFVVRLCFKGKKIRGINIYPISGKGKDVFQPTLLKSKRFLDVIKNIEKVSSIFGTKIEIYNDHGKINL